MLSIRVIATNNVDTEVFPHPHESGIFMNNTWLQLHKSALLENSESGYIRLVYIAFDSLENILQPQTTNSMRIINSKIVSASLGKGKHIQLHQPVTLCFQHLQIDNVSNPTCVFWDYTEKYVNILFFTPFIDVNVCVYIYVTDKVEHWAM